LRPRRKTEWVDGGGLCSGNVLDPVPDIGIETLAIVQFGMGAVRELKGDSQQVFGVENLTASGTSGGRRGWKRRRRPEEPR
jgi:hypothetical protein